LSSIPVVISDSAGSSIYRVTRRGSIPLRAIEEGINMEIPSPARALVQLQKSATQLHRLVIQSPLGRAFTALPGTNFLVLHTTGRNSGRHRLTPLSFTRDGDAFVVIASNGGAPRHPDWYFNLQAHPDAEVEIGGTRTGVRAETVTGADRARLWRASVRSYGGYAGYQMRASREIPVVRLTPIAPR
jgi:deazaflavin-dependent oxidoreductase (nitroreductase family)